MSAYLYDLANKNRRVVGRLHEDCPGDNFTVVEGLSAQACFSQTACIDQLEHLIRDNKEQRAVLLPSSIITVDIILQLIRYLVYTTEEPTWKLGSEQGREPRDRAYSYASVL